MMKWSILASLIMVMVFGVIQQPSISAQSQADPEAPYIYYYSDILNAFVIERADGTDNRLFATDLMPENTDTVTGAGWSPSGKYLAWSAGRHGLVVNVDGQQQLGFLDDFFHAEMVWSPREDVLVVIGLRDIRNIDVEAGQATATLQFLLVDVETADILSGFATEQTLNYLEDDQGGVYVQNLARPEVYWMPDGQHVIVSYYAREPIPEQPFISGYQIFELNGGIREVIHNENILRTQASYFGSSSAGKIAFNSADDPSVIIIEDLISGERIGEFSTDVAMRQVAWSPSGEAAVLIGDSEMWLWQAGEAMLQPVLTNTINKLLGRGVSWSPDGNYAIVQDTDGNFYLLTASTGEVQPIADVGVVGPVQWISGNRLLMSSREEQNRFYEIDVSTQNITQTFMLENPYSLYEIGQWSPDGTQFAYVNDSLAILNMADGTTTVFRPDGRSWFSNPGGETYWHPDGEWLIVAEEASIASTEPYWIGVAKSDGSVRRDLASCRDSACFGWLPENVDIDQLPPGQPQSVLPQATRILSGTDWSFYLSWSPDGSQVLRGKIDLWNGGGSTTIIDVEMGETVDDFVELDYEEGVEWELRDNGQYVPQVVDLDSEAWDSDGYVVMRSPDGEYVLISEDYSLNVYDGTGENLIMSEGRLNSVPIAAFRPDGTLVAVSGPYARVRLYDTTTWELLVTLNTNATALAFSPHGQTLAVASSWDIQLWDVETLLENGEE